MTGSRSEPHDTLRQLGMLPEQVVDLPYRARTKLVSFLRHWEEPHAALACLDPLLRQRPDLVSLHDARVKALLALGRVDTAWQAITTRNALRRSMTSEVLAARVRLAQGQTAAALVIARRLVEQNSDSIGSWQLLNEVCLACNDLDGAEEACDRMAMLRPNSRALRLARLATFRARGDYVVASAYAARVASATDQNGRLPSYILRGLRDYHLISGEVTRVRDMEERLSALYDAELAALREALRHSFGTPPWRPGQLHPDAAAPDAVPGTETAQRIPGRDEVPVSAVERRRLLEGARHHFGFDGLLPGQAETMAAALRGEDVLCVLPTGGGKSLCYQLPAMLEDDGVTLVVSPLIALTCIPHVVEGVTVLSWLRDVSIVDRGYRSVAIGHDRRATKAARRV